MVGRVPRAHLLAIVAVGLIVGLGRPASADPPRALGMPWEGDIRRGIRDQDRAVARGALDALVTRAEVRVAGPENDRGAQVVHRYLLARAYGLRAAADLRRAHGLAPGDGQAHCLARAGQDLQRAATQYRAAIRLAPRCYLALHDLGIVYLQQDPPREADAVTAFEAAAAAHPTYQAPLRRLAVVQAERGRWGAARKALEALLRLAPQDREAQGRLALALMKDGDVEAAGTHIDQLRSREPKEPVWRDLEAQLARTRGRWRDALRIYRDLAEEHPTHAAPVLGVLDILESRRSAGEAPDLAVWSWAIGRLARLARDPERKAALIDKLREIERLRREKKTTAPPTTEALARTLTSGDEAARFRVLVLLDGGDVPPPGLLLRRVFQRVASANESSVRNRRLALRLLGRHGRVELMPVLRLVARDDPDASVRLAASDAMEQVGTRDPQTRAAALLGLATLRAHEDPALAASARIGILRLSRALMDDDVRRSDARHREAFDAWWHGDVGRQARIQALAAYPATRDKWPEQVIGDVLQDPDPWVRRAGAAAWLRIREQVESGRDEPWYRTRPGYAQWRAWLLQSPRTAPAGVAPAASGSQLVDAWQRWWRKRP